MNLSQKLSSIKAALGYLALGVLCMIGAAVVNLYAGSIGPCNTHPSAWECLLYPAILVVYLASKLRVSEGSAGLIVGIAFAFGSVVYALGIFWGRRLFLRLKETK